MKVSLSCFSIPNDTLKVTIVAYFALQKLVYSLQVFIPNTDKAFTYDFALPSDASNEQTYNQAVAGMIPRLFEVSRTYHNSC